MINETVGMVIATSAVVYGTPLLYAALGELLTERAGVLNLGLEGLMLVGAVMGFLSVQRIGGASWLQLTIAVLVAAVASGAVAALHAFVTITLRANQIVSGLAVTIFAGAAGLSSYIGSDQNLADSGARNQFSALFPRSLQDLPVVGPLLFGQTALVYGSWVLTAAIGWYLSRTRAGLNVRAVGESPAAADAMGINVTAYRYVHTIVGGGLAGIGGVCYTLAITPEWTDGITGGAGWIALALVIFAFWRADLCLVGAYLFGGFSVLPLILQARGVTIAPSLIGALPYVMTIVVLVAISTGWAKKRLGAPTALGIPYHREER